MNADQIRWPQEFRPENSPIHVRNELNMQANPQAVWECLIDAERWPDWYPNAKRVRFQNQDKGPLKKGTVFRWTTFGVRISSEVVEFVPGERIAWTGKAQGLWVYHAWLIKKTDTGCCVLTEETQHGWMVRLGAWLFPHRMHKFHQIWLENMEKQAASRQSERES